MSNEPNLPGYSLQDEDEPHPHLPPSIQSPTAEPDDAQEPVLNAGDTVAATTPLGPDVAQPQPLTEQHSSATPSSPTEQPAVDEFADPKIAPLHAIFPDFDA